VFEGTLLKAFLLLDLVGVPTLSALVQKGLAVLAVHTDNEHPRQTAPAAALLADVVHLFLLILMVMLISTSSVDLIVSRSWQSFLPVHRVPLVMTMSMNS